MPPRRRTATSTQFRCRAPRVPRRRRLLRPLRGARAQRRRARDPARARACRAVCGDARRMDAVADDSVALVVTSPPYFAGKQYEEELDREGVPGSYIEYLALLRDVFAECKRVLEPGGRIAVNVANLGRKPYRSLAADVMTILQDDLHLLPRGEIVWQKGEGASGSCAWGSFRSAANPVLRDVTERVIVASKGRFGRARQPQGAPARRAAPREHHRGRRLHGPHPRRVGHPARERGAGAASSAVPRRAAPAPDGALHLPGRPRRRPVLRLGLDAGGGGALAGATPSATTSTRLRRAGPGPGGRRGAARAAPAATARRSRAAVRRGRRHVGGRAGPGGARGGRASPTCGRTADCAGWAWPSTSPPPTPRAGRGTSTWPGPNSAYRGGMVRSETVWRALGRAHVLAAGGRRPLRRAHDAAAPGRDRGRPGAAGAGTGRDLRRGGPPVGGRPGAARGLRRRPLQLPAAGVLVRVRRGPGRAA